MAPRKTKEIPLSNVPAERLFLGALLLSQHAYFQYEQTITSNVFTSALHRDIYGVIGDILNANGKLSESVLAAKLPEESEGHDGESVTTVAYLSTLRHTAQTAAVSAGDVADQLAELAARRQALAVGERLMRAAKEGGRPAIDIASDAESALLDVMQISSPSRARRISDFASNVVHGARRAQDEQDMPGLTWGLPTLDEIMGLMLGGDLGFIIAAQGDGKTALATQVAAHVSRSGPVLFGSFEMTGDGIAARELASASEVPVRTVEEGTFNTFEWEKIRDAEKSLATPQLWILDDRKLTVRQLRAHAMGMKRTMGLRAIFVDQLDKLRTDKFSRDRFERYAEVTSDLKDMAKELRVPIVVLAQRTRFAQRREDDTPQTDDADAPSIERDADWVIGLWNRFNWLKRHRPPSGAGQTDSDKWHVEVDKARDKVSVIVLKHRRRQAFEQRNLKWEGQFTRLSELNA
jgi:replicative DNA helicase